MTVRLLLVGALAAAAACVGPDPHAEERRQFIAGEAANRAFYAEEFAREGFPSADAALADGAEIRGFIVRDPYAMLPIPLIEIERSRDGAVTLRLTPRGGGDPVATPLPRESWQTVTAADSWLFVPKKFVPGPPDEPAPRGVCHGWSVRFAALDSSGQRVAGASQCGKDGAAGDYAMTILRLAMSTRPECKEDSDGPFWSFSRCFAPQREDAS